MWATLSASNSVALPLPSPSGVSLDSADVSAREAGTGSAGRTRFHNHVPKEVKRFPRYPPGSPAGRSVGLCGSSPPARGHACGHRARLATRDGLSWATPAATSFVFSRLGPTTKHSWPTTPEPHRRLIRCSRRRLRRLRGVAGRAEPGGGFPQFTGKEWFDEVRGSAGGHAVEQVGG